MASEPILIVDSLSKAYKVQAKWGQHKTVKAVEQLSFCLYPGQTLGVVGESGCGKSTLAKLLMGLETPDTGSIRLQRGDAYQTLDEKSRRDHQASIQMIFQDPLGSLNPRKKAWEIIAAPLLVNQRISRQAAREKARALMAEVGLPTEALDRYPHMFSGGQRQRLGIARALILRPDIVICDEPVSALDASVQAQVLNLLMDLQDDLRLSYVFISHDLSVVQHICDTILVMYLGRIVEYAPRQQIFANPMHPYTRGLLAAAPSLSTQTDTEPVGISGELPSPLNPPPGCSFHTRCPFASQRCRSIVPELRNVNGRMLACHHPQTNEAMNPAERVGARLS